MIINIKRFALPLLLLAYSSTALCATLQVTSTADNPGSPSPCTFIVSDNYNCNTLRDAIIAANTLPGQDVIKFEGIDRNNPANNCPVAGLDKVCKITINSSAFLPKITSSIIIDGSIPESRPNIPGSVKNPQVAATKRPGIELSGQQLIISSTAIKPGLWLVNANDSTIEGLVINRFPGPGIMASSSSNLKILGNYLGLDATATVAAVWNGAYTACSSDCYGNLGAGGTGLTVGLADNIQIGGLNNNERNISSNNFSAGISLFDATNSKIVGNFTGTDVYGVAKMGNRVENLEIRGYTGAVRTQLGLTPPPDMGPGSKNNIIDSNLILDGKTHANMRLLGRTQLYKPTAADDGVIQTNTIENTVIINNLNGVNLVGNQAGALAQSGLNINDSVINTKIGFEENNGQFNPQPNIFTNSVGGVYINNNLIPIVIGPTATSGGNMPASTLTKTYGNLILYNSIYNNSLLGKIGIDLAAGAGQFTGDGVTLNDSKGHGDTLPNRMQNFPTLNGSTSFINPDKAQVNGSLDSEPNKEYLVQIFANAVANPSGYGEGQVFIGEQVVSTDSNGHVDFHIETAAHSPAVKDASGICNPAPVLTSTATDKVTGDTSEFSQVVSVVVNGNENAYKKRCD